MNEALHSMAWLNQPLKKDNWRKVETDIDQVVIIDDISDDFSLTPEEYKLLYEKRWGTGEELPVTPDEYAEAYRAGEEKHLFSISWLSGSIDLSPQRENKDPVVIIEETPAKLLELDPEEYRRIKEEILEAEKRQQAYREGRGYLYETARD